MTLFFDDFGFVILMKILHHTQNTFGKGRQAVALRVSGDRAAFYGCRILSYQDTLLDDGGRHYFSNCYIEGATDFIFGNATSLYEVRLLNICKSYSLILRDYYNLRIYSFACRNVICIHFRKGQVLLPHRAGNQKKRTLATPSWVARSPGQEH